MWKLVPKHEAAELVLLCMEAKLPLMWATEHGSFIKLDENRYSALREAEDGEIIVWLGADSPVLSHTSITGWEVLFRDDLCNVFPNWRE